jgi:predicted anti-sigma-YlaC factor YlaD
METTELLSRSMDIEIPPEKMAVVKEHISGCRGCSLFIEQLHIIRELCKKFSTAILRDLTTYDNGHLSEEKKLEIIDLLKR